MPRATNKAASHRKRRKFLQYAKGYWGRRKNVWTVAKNHIEKGFTHSYRDRRLNRRNFRSLWIIRINAAARMLGTNYSKLMFGLKSNNISINRKVLADLAMNKPSIFESIVKKVIA